MSKRRVFSWWTVGSFVGAGALVLGSTELLIPARKIFVKLAKDTTEEMRYVFAEETR